MRNMHLKTAAISSAATLILVLAAYGGMRFIQARSNGIIGSWHHTGSKDELQFAATMNSSVGQLTADLVGKKGLVPVIASPVSMSIDLVVGSNRQYSQTTIQIDAKGRSTKDTTIGTYYTTWDTITFMPTLHIHQGLSGNFQMRDSSPASIEHFRIDGSALTLSAANSNALAVSGPHASNMPNWIAEERFTRT